MENQIFKTQLDVLNALLNIKLDVEGAADELAKREAEEAKPLDI